MRLECDWRDLRRPDPVIELPDPAQIRAYRSMTPGERVAAGMRMADAARAMLLTSLRTQHLTASEEEIRRLLVRRFHGIAG